MEPTPYQHGLYNMFRELARDISPNAEIPDLADVPDNGDGRDDVIIRMGTMFTITIPPTGDRPLELPTSAFRLREDIRAIMRAGGEVPVDISERTWWPADLIREITEWHDAGRPDAETTISRLRATDHVLVNYGLDGDIGPIIPSMLARAAVENTDPHEHEHETWGWHRHRAKREHLHASRQEFTNMHECAAALAEQDREEDTK